MDTPDGEQEAPGRDRRPAWETAQCHTLPGMAAMPRLQVAPLSRL